MTYLIDANTLSDSIAPKPNQRVAARLKEHTGGYGIAAPAFHEMVYGCQRLPKSKRRTMIEAYLVELEASIPILPYDAAAARWHAKERARLYQKTPAFVDGQIAAIAAVRDLIVVTRNFADFRPFSVTIENWFD